MKKLFLSLFLIFGLFIGLSYTHVQADSQGPINEQFSFNWSINLPSQAADDALETALTVDYGDNVTFDVGTLTPEGYTFVGFQLNGKVELNASKFTEDGIRVTQDTDVDAFFKANGETAVIFMDANQDFIETRYTDVDDLVIYDESTNPIPDHLANPKPGLVAQGWTANGTDLIDFSVDTFTEDTVVYVKYGVDPSQSTSTLTVINGDLATGEPVDGVYDYNEVATVEASGSGTFQYWLKDGIIASLQSTYSFTMIADTTVEAVFDESANYDPDDAFITISAPYAIRDGYNSLVGQFHVPSGHDLIEYGILAADLEGGITFNTPSVEKIRSNKYYPVTNEFMMSFPDSETRSYRAYMITTDGTTETITYSYMHQDGNTSELFISEYLDWDGGTNKAIELFNGTDAAISLDGVYTLKVNSNDNITWGSDISLTGTIQAGDTFIIANASESAITSLADQTTGSLSPNGDDAIGLFKDGTLIDIFGVFGEDPGSGWTIEGGNTADATVIRNASVVGPYVDNSDTYPKWNPNEWTSMDDTTTYLGSHTINYPQIPVQDSELPGSLLISGGASVNVGETITLTESYPSGGLEGVIWFSSNDALATVNQSGVVTGVGEGEVTISLYSYYSHNIVDTHTVNVLPIQTYDVTFESNGGSSVTTQTVNGGESATEPTDPTQAGFEFAGWFTDDTTFLNEYNFATAVDDNITLYAKWNEEYDITYVLNDGTNNGSNPSIYTVETPTITLLEPTRDGYVFDGWFEEIDYSGTEVTEITLGSTGDITLYAKWVDEAVAETTYVETFTNLGYTGGSYQASSFVGDNSITWTYTESRGDYSLDGQAILLDKNGDGSSLSATITGGISSFSIDFYDAFSGPAQVELWINGVLIATSVSFDDDGDGSVYETFVVDNINISGEFTIEILAAGSQMVLDNLTWETYTNPS
jgi:uncharacterized repeat protein (TIGR02543 family)